MGYTIRYENKTLADGIGGGVAATCVIVSVSSAQSAYRERVLIQRNSLLGNMLSIPWPFFYYNFNTRGVRTPDPVPVNNNPYSAGVTNAPVQRDPVVQPGSFGPVANGISPTTLGPVRKGGSCASCIDGSTPQNGNCPASGGGSGEKCGNITCSVSQTCCNGMPFREPTCTDRPFCPICLSSASKIATPIGEVVVTTLQVGDIIWTIDRLGNRIVRPLVKASHISVSNHHVIHLVLADGRTLDVSAPHPTADGRTVGDLTAGDAYDGSVVKSAALKPYEGSATYDILPAGDTGYYWANGILMGSTLK